MSNPEYVVDSLPSKTDPLPSAYLYYYMNIDGFICSILIAWSYFPSSFLLLGFNEIDYLYYVALSILLLAVI